MDVRSVCTLAATDPAAVDLSFYDVPWYGDLTGPFARACFQAPGLGVTPARRDNLTGQSLPETDPYDSGALVGEGYCGDLGAFTIDFDDAGKDSDESDGTDWGNDDYLPKCGAVRAGYAWYVFARE